MEIERTVCIVNKEEDICAPAEVMFGKAEDEDQGEGWLDRNEPFENDGEGSGETKES